MVLSTAGSGKKKVGAVFQPGIYLRTYSPAISICDVAILIAKAEAAATALMDRNAATAAAAAACDSLGYGIRLFISLPD